MKQNLMKETKKINSTVVENSRYFYIFDNINSASWICDKDGNPLQHLRYYPYGEILLSQKASGSTYDSPYQYVGNEYDSESGYNNMNARYYWSNLGMFFSVDKLAEKYPMFTPYNYAGNNPINLSDPSGLDFDPKIDEKNKTITINATYYTSKDNKDNLQAGVDAWKAQSGKYSYKTEGGDSYSINFNLTVKGDYENIDAAANAFVKDKSGAANLFQFNSDINNRGETTDGNQIDVQSDAPPRTTVHEIGHTLGIGEFMESGGNSKDIHKNNVINIMKKAGFDAPYWNNGPQNKTPFGEGKPAKTYNMKGRINY